MSKFIPQKRNANKHTLHGLRLLEKSIQQDGFIDAQTAAADGEIISGSARLELSAEKFADVEPIVVQSDGTRPIIVVRTDIPNLDDPRAKRLSVAANQIAHTDYDPDGELLKEWAGEDEAIRAMFADSEWREITGEEKPARDAEPQTDKAAELLEKWGVKLGDLWQIGEHRLICGDCTDAATVARVKETSRLTLTDPPYDFDTDGGGILKAEGTMQKIKDAGINVFDPLTLTKESETSVYFCNKTLIPVYIELAKSWGVAWDLAVSHKPFHAANWQGHLATDLEYIMVLGKQAPYTGQEPALYSKLWTGQKEETDEKDIKWAKPLDLIQKFVRLFTVSGDIVYEPFCGSGTCLVACENLGRKCRAVEISPAYVAVALERMATAFPDLTIARME